MAGFLSILVAALFKKLLSSKRVFYSNPISWGLQTHANGTKGAPGTRDSACNNQGHVRSFNTVRDKGCPRATNRGKMSNAS